MAAELPEGFHHIKELPFLGIDPNQCEWPLRVVARARIRYHDGDSREMHVAGRYNGFSVAYYPDAIDIDGVPHIKYFLGHWSHPEKIRSYSPMSATEPAGLPSGDLPQA